MARIRPPRLRQADLEVTPTTPSKEILPAVARLLKKGQLEDAVRKLGRLGEAIACQHRTLEIAPDYAKAHYNLGNTLKEASKRDASVRAYGQAVAHNPGHAEAHNNRGTVLEGQGHAHAYDFEDIVHFMAQRSRLKAHWRGLYGE